MNIAQRSIQFMQGFLKSYGPSNIKKILWDKEFSGGKWNFIDNTAGDCVYPHLARHLHKGGILDLGAVPAIQPTNCLRVPTSPMSGWIYLKRPY